MYELLTYYVSVCVCVCVCHCSNSAGMTPFFSIRLPYRAVSLSIEPNNQHLHSGGCEDTITSTKHRAANTVIPDMKLCSRPRPPKAGTSYPVATTAKAFFARS